jgi:3-deoxy-D-manno-octulosonic acid hydroxylase-like protein
MIKIHDAMKGDDHYQKTVPQCEVRFPPNSSWIVFTDQVSHAAMSGQHVLEQTFHLPSEGIKNCSTNPLNVLEKRLNQTLI